MFLVGASHMRNAAFCLRQSCWRHRVMRNAVIRTVNYMEEAYAVTKHLLDNYTSTDGQPKERVIVVQTGSWDLGFR